MPTTVEGSRTSYGVIKLTRVGPKRDEPITPDAAAGLVHCMRIEACELCLICGGVGSISAKNIVLGKGTKDPISETACRIPGRRFEALAD